MKVARCTSCGRYFSVEKSEKCPYCDVPLEFVSQEQVKSETQLETQESDKGKSVLPTHHIEHVEQEQTKAEAKFQPPKAAQENARRALRWRDEHPDEVQGGTRVGWTRANQLASGKPVSLDIVKRMAQFARHAENAEIASEHGGTPWKDAGHVAYLLWGGDEGIDWAKRVAEREGKKQVGLDTIAQTIANSEGVKVSADDIKATLLIPWLATTAGTPEALVLQKTAARTFGHKLPMRMADEFEQVDVRWDMMVPIGTIYNNTQEHLKAKGLHEGDTLEVYHPYLPSEVGPRSWQKGDEVRVKLNPLTSWSTNIQDAVTFASFLSSPGKPAFILKTFIPVKSVVSLPETGFGLPGTDEVILAGGEYEALVEARLE